MVEDVLPAVPDVSLRRLGRADAQGLHIEQKVPPVHREPWLLAGPRHRCMAGDGAWDARGVRGAHQGGEEEQQGVGEDLCVGGVAFQPRL